MASNLEDNPEIPEVRRAVALPALSHIVTTVAERFSVSDETITRGARGRGKVSFTSTGAEAKVIPHELTELPLLRGFDDAVVLDALAERFVQREFKPGEVIVETGKQADQLILVAHGKLSKLGIARYGDEVVLGRLADGDYFGDRTLAGTPGAWEFTAKAVTATTVLALSRKAFEELLHQSEVLRRHVERFQAGPQRPVNTYGEASIEIASGHVGEPDLPETFVDYELSPREYELSVAQTVLKVYTRVADLYNEPMNQSNCFA